MSFEGSSSIDVEQSDLLKRLRQLEEEFERTIEAQCASAQRLGQILSDVFHVFKPNRWSDQSAADAKPRSSLTGMR